MTLLLRSFMDLQLTVILAAGLSGCANHLADFEALSAKTAAELDAKTQQYVHDTNIIDSVRQSEQANAEHRLLTTIAATDTRLSAMGLSGDIRQSLVMKLRQASDQYLSDKLKTPSPDVGVTAPVSPAMTDVVTALDKLSAPPSLIENAKELYAYFKEVDADLTADRSNKAAETALSAAGAPSKP